MKRKKIFYTTLNFAAFVKKDIAIFEAEYEVYVFHFQPYPKWKTPFSLLKQLAFLYWHFFSTDIYICQFGGYHTLLPALFSKLSGKKSLIITGGTDCVSFPSIRYGNFHKKALGAFTKWSYLWTSHIAPVHKSLIFNEYSYQDADYPQQGILAFCKGITTPMTEIFNGYDTSFFYNVCTQKKPNSFITVAVGASGKMRFQLKGIDLCVEAARQLPDYQFTIVGVENTSVLDLPINVKVFPVVNAAELRTLLSQHEFYLQLSMSEGFPNAPCEAMLCECIPIGSVVGALPDIIGDTGFLLPKRELSLLQALIQTATQSDKKSLALAARQRIITHFSLERRKKALLDLLRNI